MRGRQVIGTFLVLAIAFGALSCREPATPPSYPATPGEECTIGVACAWATRDGRPLLWKTRDTSKVDNEVYYNSAFEHRFIAVVNADGGPDSSAWMGVNEHGFAILNANAAGLAPPDSHSRGNGDFMRDALATCRSVEMFVAMLDSTNSARETTANFGVIDSTGAAFIFEASHDTYWTYDASETPDGYLVRTNFACCDTILTGPPTDSGIERFRRSNALIDQLTADSNLSHESLLDTQMRDFSDWDSNTFPVPCYSCGSQDSLYGFINTRWSICHYTSVSAAIIQGVPPAADPPEPAALSTMWVLLGHPAATVALPYWPVGPAPPVADGIPTAPLCDRARLIQRAIFSCAHDHRLADSFMLLDGEGGGLWTEILPLESAILGEVGIRLVDWRADPPGWDEMLAYEDSLAQSALDALMNLTASLEPETFDFHSSLLGRNHPNPFRASTVVDYRIPRAASVQLAVYDPRGRKVAELVDAILAPGRYSATWDARGTATGIYLIRLTVGPEQHVRKCFHLK